MLKMSYNFIFIIFLSIAGLYLVGGAVRPEIECTENLLTITVPKEKGGGSNGGPGKGGKVAVAELEKWGRLPGCQMDSTSLNAFTITLPLSNELRCGITKVKNKILGDTYYYHHVALTSPEGQRRVYKVSCLVPSTDRGNIVKRNVLPAEFVEPDFIEITSEISGTAPVPEVSVAVRQDGGVIGNSVNIAPGAPLTMEVFLDENSSSTYGILVSYMMVTDNSISNKNETIIFNGCTQDRYLFENFQTASGDFLQAKFRAFKFPESNYLLFRGTVDVCLDKCTGISCSNGEIGYGRKRRSLPTDSADPNKIFEVTMMTFITLQEEVKDTPAPPGHPRTQREDPSKTPRTFWASRQEDIPLLSRDGEPPAPLPVMGRSNKDPSYPPYIYFDGTTNRAQSPMTVMWVSNIVMALIAVFIARW